eukprot:254171-Chlamydomonas_euryale.AAC.9
MSTYFSGIWALCAAWRGRGRDAGKGCEVWRGAGARFEVWKGGGGRGKGERCGQGVGRGARCEALTGGWQRGARCAVEAQPGAERRQLGGLRASVWAPKAARKDAPPSTST